MKKKGFTLIELLAVIVIMGILMFATIPAINRTIENARKDTFINTAQNYARAVETLWNADGLECKSGYTDNYVISSALSSSDAGENGAFYVVIDTTGDDARAIELLQQGGKSPWGNKDVDGIVAVTWVGNDIKFIPILADGSRKVNPNQIPYDEFGSTSRNTLIASSSIRALEDQLYPDFDFDFNTCRLV